MMSMQEKDRWLTRTRARELMIVEDRNSRDVTTIHRGPALAFRTVTYTGKSWRIIPHSGMYKYN